MKKKKIMSNSEWNRQERISKMSKEDVVDLYETQRKNVAWVLFVLIVLVYGLAFSIGVFKLRADFYENDYKEMKADYEEVNADNRALMQFMCDEIGQRYFTASKNSDEKMYKIECEYTNIVFDKDDLRSNK